MKLRCTTNSIRIRIRKSDMRQLAETGSITEAIAFPIGNSFTFTLRVNDDIDALTAQYQANDIAVHLPKSTAEQWINSNDISLEHHQTLHDGKTLHLLVEKDLPCLDRPEEDKSDTFEELDKGCHH